MHLKRITLCGFKSFADKVDLDFGPGITCVVGPNGCGKSNVVDAVKWVLGEQSARSLRGRQMGDMIFGGSSTRRSSSVAEVEIVFDNCDRRLALDLDDIAITRRLYRSGDSEYLINRQTTRLKDVRDLFLDTGVGTEAYSVIEQGRVDLMLQANPADRRFIFEEAAGISKYKARRREAERRLERTEHNLLRVTDIIEELEKRVRSVKLQAGKARSFQEYQTRLRLLRSKFYLAEYQRHSQELQQLARRATELSDDSTSLRGKIAHLEADSATVTVEVDRLNEQIVLGDASLHQAKSGFTSCEERIHYSTQRVAEQNAVHARLLVRRNEDLARVAEKERELSASNSQLSDLVQQEDQLNHQIQVHSDEDHRIARECNEIQALFEDDKAAVIELMRRAGQRNNDLARLNGQQEMLADKKAALHDRAMRVQTESQSLQEQCIVHQRHLGEIDLKLTALNRELELQRGEAGRVDGVRRRLVDESSETNIRRGRLESRRDVLRDLERRFEGVGAAARSLLERKQLDPQSDGLDNICGLVADIFDVDIEHAAAVEGAISGLDQALVIRDARRALSDPNLLADLPGSLTVIPLDGVPPIFSYRVQMDGAGVVAPAMQLVRVRDEFQQLAHHLLDKTIVVDSRESAIAMSRNNPQGLRFVTLAGELFEADGRMSLGPRSATTGLISRRSELTNIDQQLRQLDLQLDELQNELAKANQEVTEIEVRQQTLRTTIHQWNTERVEAAAALRNLEEASRRLHAESPMIEQEATMLDLQIAETVRQVAVASDAILALEQEGKSREAEAAERRKRVEELELQRREIHEQLTHCRVVAAQVVEKRSALRKSVNALEAALLELQAAIRAGAEDLHATEQRIAEANSIIELSRTESVRLAEQIAAIDLQTTELRRQREAQRVSLEHLGFSIKERAKELATCENALHECRMFERETTVRREELCARALSELQTDLTQMFENPDGVSADKIVLPECHTGSSEDWAAIESEIEELRRKIDRLGNVNLDAIAELKEIEERHEFLASQRNDLQSAKDQLRELMAQLDAESLDRFTRSFEQIREHFRTLFRKLFGGGKADIVLEQPENVLESGIEIFAQPPGKELQAISLMSGGEKTMTAIALLMSIFRTRPAPFAVLDEVDAALDEANNERFNRILAEFVSESQFIVVTHSRMTMNAANRLYGITMQEPGVSTPVGVQLAGVSAA